MSSALVAWYGLEVEASGVAARLKRRRWLAHGLLAAAGLLCGMLYVWPPEHSGFYPECPVHAWFHVLCPGCGATRALAALLHGRVADAWRLNALFVVLLPFAVGLAVACYRRAVGVSEFCWPRVPQAVLYGTLACAVAFMVARNVASM